MKRLFYSMLFVLSVFHAYADQKQIVVVDGNYVGKSVSNVTFQGTKANITYSDGSMQTVDRSAFAIYINGIAATAVEKPKVNSGVQEKHYTIDGKALGNVQHKGVVIKGKKKHVVRK